MKSLSTYLIESITMIDKSSADYTEWKEQNSHPRNKKQLEKIIQKAIQVEGLNCDLNWIDVSKVTDMSFLFSFSQFNGDISKWDVSKVKKMRHMFKDSPLESNPPAWYKE